MEMKGYSFLLYEIYPSIYPTNIYWLIVSFSRWCQNNAELHPGQPFLCPDFFQGHYPPFWPPHPGPNPNPSLSVSRAVCLHGLADSVSSLPVSRGLPEEGSDISLLCLVSSNQVTAAQAYPVGKCLTALLVSALLKGRPQQRVGTS